MEFEVNNDINSKVSFYQGNITKLNVDVIVNSVNKTLIKRGRIDGAIDEVAWPRLLDNSQKLNGCESSECKVTLGYKLLTKYVFHTVRLRDKNSYKLKDFYKVVYNSCLLIM